jgi:hypothetical protein
MDTFHYNCLIALKGFLYNGIGTLHLFISGINNEIGTIYIIDIDMGGTIPWFLVWLLKVTYITYTK